MTRETIAQLLRAAYRLRDSQQRQQWIGWLQAQQPIDE